MASGLAAACQGCTDLLSVPNPRNCVTSARPCNEGFTCNQQTQRCEPAPRGCMEQPSLCSEEQVCDSEQNRCVPQRFVIGQPDDHSNLNTSYGMSRPYAAKLVRDQIAGKTKLAVADWDNDRTLIWNEVPVQNRPADVVLGQQDVMTTTLYRAYGPLNPGILYTPWSIASDGTNLLVAERNYHRISFWSPLPTQSGINRLLLPSGFWGQSNYSAPKPNAGLPTVNALGVKNPVAFAEERPRRGFYISDYGNRRVLVFDGIPADFTTPPKWVIGQPDFTSAGVRPTQTGVGAPYGLFSDGTQLFVADEEWNRVLVYDLPITQNEPAPVMVIGQPDLASVAVNRGGAPAASTLHGPTDVTVTSSGGVRRLWICDSRNQRILSYTLPSTTADLVVGHKGFTTSVANDNGPIGNIGLSTPVTVTSDGVRLVVAEVFNRRVQIWNTLPTQNGQPSDVVLGEPDPSTRLQNAAPAVHGLQFNQPSSVTSDGTHLFVADAGHNRVLIWNRIPKDGATAPDVVLGQHDFSGYLANQDGISASSLSNPQDVRSDGTQLIVADSDNNRVLIWRQLPTSNFAPADAVLGQPDISQNTAGVSAQRLNEPQAVLFYDSYLLVADQMNHRVLRFDAPYSTNAAATLVLGQPDMLASQMQGGMAAVSARGLNHPYFLARGADRILVADSQNHRVLLWNRMPTSDFAPADIVIGAKDFGTATVGADPAQRLYYPAGLHIDGGRLYVSSSWSNRILVWDQLPTVNGSPADFGLGRSDLTSDLPNDAALAPVDRLSLPMGLTSVQGRLFIADQENNRVIGRELPQ